MEGKSALDSRFDAQRIALVPLVFQATRVTRNLGILDALRESHSLEENGVAFSRGDTAIQLADNQCCSVVLALVQIQS